MPAHTVAAPFQKPSNTPAAAETMLEGTGRNTSVASSVATHRATDQRDPSPRATRSASTLKYSSNRRNGIRITSRTARIMTNQRISVPTGYQTVGVDAVGPLSRYTWRRTFANRWTEYQPIRAFRPTASQGVSIMWISKWMFAAALVAAVACGLLVRGLVSPVTVAHAA